VLERGEGGLGRGGRGRWEEAMARTGGEEQGAGGGRAREKKRDVPLSERKKKEGK